MPSLFPYLLVSTIYSFRLVNAHTSSYLSPLSHLSAGEKIALGKEDAPGIVQLGIV
jgi:hypothetical protein